MGQIYIVYYIFSYICRNLKIPSWLVIRNKMKITFIGAGNMGGSAARAFVKYGVANPADVTVTAKHETSLEKFRHLGINATLDNAEAVKDADIVIFAVKPWIMEDAIAQSRDNLDFNRQIIVSFAPGVSSENLLQWLRKADGALPHLAYVIPNTAIEIAESMTFIAPVSTDKEQTDILKKIFGKLGSCTVVEENMMLAGTSIASCGIAYAMRYISAAAEGGKELGLPAKDIDRIVCQTVTGASKLISEHKSNPEHEIDKVTTPGGLTLKGLAAMERAGFTESVKKGLSAISPKKSRIVVKIGSNALTRPDGALDTTRMSSIVDQIVSLKKSGYEIILVSSGAVACGRSLIPENRKLNKVQQRQLYSALGQVRLMDMYYTLFGDYGVNVGQILTMKKNFSTKKERFNMQSCMEVMLQSGVVPVVNENDTISITELMFTDNDELSGLMARLMGADCLILLSNVDGVCDAMPEEGGKVIRTIRPEDSTPEGISTVTSKSGRGGMMSKYKTAAKLASDGIRVMIANGRRNNILIDLLNDPENTIHTEFIPK